MSGTTVAAEGGANRTEIRLRWVAHLFALLAGAAFGWHAGLRMSGTLMAFIMAANSAFFASLAAGAVIDIGTRCFRREEAHLTRRR